MSLPLVIATSYSPFQAEALRSRNCTVTCTVTDDVQFVSSAWIYCLFTACSTNQYKCDMGLCVHMSTWCDGYRDCPDGSDELPGCNGSKL